MLDWEFQISDFRFQISNWVDKLIGLTHYGKPVKQK